MPNPFTNPIMGRQPKRQEMKEAGDVRYFDPVSNEEDGSLTGGVAGLPLSLYTALLVMPIVGGGTGAVKQDLIKPSDHHVTKSACENVLTRNCKGNCGCQPKGIVLCCCTSIALVVPWVAAFLVSCCLQGAFIYFIGESAVRHANPLGCPATNWLLRLTGVVTLTAYCTTDIYETFSMFFWVILLPTTESTEIMQLLYDPETGEPVGYASGVSKWYKATTSLFVILPKLVIGLALWWYGSTFVARSVGNDELILNAVAVVFVLEIDDQLAKVTIPQRMAQLLAKLPPIPLYDPTEEANGSLMNSCFDNRKYFGQWLNFGLMTVMVVAVKLTACAAADAATDATLTGSGTFTDES
jgi:hypothetical protein